MASLADFVGYKVKPSKEIAEKSKRIISGFTVEVLRDKPIAHGPTRQHTTLRGLYNIDKRYHSGAQLNAARKALTVTPKNQTIAVPRSYPLFRETTNYLQVPRFYGLKHFGRPSVDLTTNGEPLNDDVRMLIEPRDYQIPYLNALRKIFARGEGIGSQGALLVLSCGGGKTFSAIWTAITLRLKCAVLVHNSDLMAQWKERATQFSTASVGIVRSDVIQIADITIFMMQSVLTKRYDSERKAIFEPFGLVVVDEAHHICAETLSRSLARFNARCILGLSATPERKDGLGFAIEYFTGSVCVVGKRVNTGGCLVKVEKVTVGRAREIKMRNGRALLSKTVTMMSEDDSRNARIAKVVKRLFVDEGRCIILTTDRRAHLKVLKECIMAEGIDEEDIGIFAGETSKKRVRMRDEHKKRPILIATYGMASEGFDKPELDTLCSKYMTFSLLHD